jgi:exosome complex RNA-binding protein Csl4
MEKVGQVVMPGEVIGKVDPTKTTKIGIGVIQNQENLIATKSGILRSKGNHVWVDNRQKRVRPLGPRAQSPPPLLSTYAFVLDLRSDLAWGRT